MTKAVYAGCGFDVIPIKLFPNIEYFIYIDIMPTGDRGYVNTFAEFMDNIVKTFKTIGMNLIRHDKKLNMIIFWKENKIVKYYYSTWVENINNVIKDEIKQCDYLILIGYAPPREFLDIFGKISLITSDTTYIAHTEDVYHSDKDKFLLDRKVNLELFPKKIKDVYYIQFDNEITIKYFKPSINLLL